MPKANARSRTATRAAKTVGRKTAPGKSAAPRKAVKAELGSGARARPGAGGAKAGSRAARRVGGKPASKSGIKTAARPTMKAETKKVEKKAAKKAEEKKAKKKPAAFVGHRATKGSSATFLAKGQQASFTKQEKGVSTEARATMRSAPVAAEGTQTAPPAKHAGKDAGRTRAAGTMSSEGARSGAESVKVQEPVVAARGTSDAQNAAAPNGPTAGGGAGGGGHAEDGGPRPGLPVPIASFTI